MNRIILTYPENFKGDFLGESIAIASQLFLTETFFEKREIHIFPTDTKKLEEVFSEIVVSNLRKFGVKVEIK